MSYQILRNTAFIISIFITFSCNTESNTKIAKKVSMDKVGHWGGLFLVYTFCEFLLFNIYIFCYFFQTIAFQNQEGIRILNLNVIAVYYNNLR